MINFLNALIVLLFCLFQSTVCETNNTILDYRSTLFPITLTNETLREVNLGFERDARILAYIDFKNTKEEKSTDIIVSIVDDQEQETIKFYYYDVIKGIFINDETEFDFESIQLEKGQAIKNLIATDINKDDILDLIITYKDKGGKIYTNICLGYKDTQNKDYTKFRKSERIVNSEFVFGDFNGDRLLDFIFYDFSGKQRKLMYAEVSKDPDPEKDLVIKDFKDIVSDEEDCVKVYFFNPINKDHSSAFIDINGDCINDLLIHSSKDGNQFLEFWIGRKNSAGDIKYCLKEIKSIKKEFGLFSLSDVNNDGHLDIVFPIRNSQPPAIFVAYNQKKFNYDWTKNYCESVQSIKYDKNENLFDDFNDKIITNFTSVFNLTNEENMVYYESDKSPLLIRFGDLNLDSFADIITVLKNITDNTKFFRIIMNTPIKADEPIPVKNSYFDYSKTHRYINYTDVEYVSFFDLDENGQLDVLMVRKVNKDYNITGFFNVEAYDNFFLKSLTTKSRNNFFSSEIGTNYRYYVTDLKGERKLRVGTQHAQTSCLNLELPYSFMGIGPSYNYVENYHVSTSSSKNHTDSYLKVFTPIIPNSQLLIYNYNENTEVDNWELDLIVTPISKILLVVIVILVILAILLVVIIVLHFMEKRDDESKEEQQLWL